MNGAPDAFRVNLRSWIVRIAGLFVFWIILAGLEPADLAAGLVTAIAAAAVSFQVLPSGSGQVRPVMLVKLLLRFLHQSVSAGIDVAWRALHPRMPLHPGFVVYNPQSTAGRKRDAFCTMTSLLPGTLPAGTDENGRLLIHCLDTTQPVADQLRREESLFNRAIGGASRDG